MTDRTGQGFAMAGQDAGMRSSPRSSPLSEVISAQEGSTLAMVRAALAEGRVILAYQPVVQTARPDQVAFYEGLARVIDPTGRIIPASDFIDEVEETPQGREMDALALEFGLDALARVPELRLSINMSARSIGYPRWNEVLRKGLARDETVGERLILEITESTAITMPDIVQVFMADLQTRGISFAIDDFGAGYTSFRYLKDLYFDILKIDGAYCRGISESPDNQALVRAMVDLGRHFDMFTVAEAVETHDDAEMLVEIGLDCLQGYYFGAPTIRPYWVAQDPRVALTA